MLGYDMSWASFHVVEVMSSPRYHLKTVGYLAATQTFNQDTDVLMLTTNLLKKVRSNLRLCLQPSLGGPSHPGFDINSSRCCGYIERDITYSHPGFGSRSVA